MMDIMKDGPVNPVKIQDNTFRDGHQSIYATRMRTEDMLPIAEQMDEMGFWAMEVWGGATFDTMHRFLGEDPWERPKVLKKYIKKTPFTMLLRGQNLVGYRNYAPAEDYEFFLQLGQIGTFANLPEYYLNYRIHPGGESARKARLATQILKVIKLHKNSCPGYLRATLKMYLLFILAKLHLV